MLEKTETVVGPDVAESWRHYLRGLWCSGLRLGESLELYWDDDTKLCVQFVEGEVLLRIPAELEKGHKDRLLPIAPEFAEFLNETPPGQRAGPVFNPKARRVCGPRLNFYRVSETIREIGKAAGILINRGGRKYASAHDLRRSFGERWAALIMPQALMELMRHESIETTLKYYVGQNAQRTSRLVREAYERAEAAKTRANQQGGELRDTLRDTCPKSDEEPPTSNSEPRSS